MRIIIFLILVQIPLLYTIPNINWQLNKKTIKVGNERYSLESVDRNSNSIFVFNANNKLWNKQMLIPSKVTSFNSINNNYKVREKIIEILRETIIIDHDREKIKKHIKGFMIIYFVNDSGKVMELAFALDDNIKFSIKYLPEIERRIKKEVIFTFSNDELKGANFLRFSNPFGAKTLFGD